MYAAVCKYDYLLKLMCDTVSIKLEIDHATLQSSGLCYWLKPETVEKFVVWAITSLDSNSAHESSELYYASQLET